MTEQGTYQTLILLERNIQQQNEASLAFKFFNRTATKNFYQRNQQRLKLAHLRINEFVEQHVRKDEKGDAIKQKLESGVEEYVFFTDADRVEYNAKLEVFLNQSIDIHH